MLYCQSWRETSMPKMDDSKPQRPPLALRLGITGARNLRADQLVRIRTQVRDVFGYLDVSTVTCAVCAAMSRNTSRLQYSFSATGCSCGSAMKYSVSRY